MVVRINSVGELKNSRPCNNCIDIMIKYKIKKVIYSTDEGIIKSEKPKNMEKSHCSSGWNAYYTKF